jgi:hypothetical protein
MDGLVYGIAEYQLAYLDKTGVWNTDERRKRTVRDFSSAGANGRQS